jgi:hypothetical protein
MAGTTRLAEMVTQSVLQDEPPDVRSGSDVRERRTPRPGSRGRHDPLASVPLSPKVPGSTDTGTFDTYSRHPTAGRRLE